MWYGFILCVCSLGLLGAVESVKICGWESMSHIYLERGDRAPFFFLSQEPQNEVYMARRQNPNENQCPEEFVSIIASSAINTMSKEVSRDLRTILDILHFDGEIEHLHDGHWLKFRKSVVVGKSIQYRRLKGILNHFGKDMYTSKDDFLRYAPKYIWGRVWPMSFAVPFGGGDECYILVMYMSDAAIPRFLSHYGLAGDLRVGANDASDYRVVSKEVVAPSRTRFFYPTDPSLKLKLQQYLYDEFKLLLERTTPKYRLVTDAEKTLYKLCAQTQKMVTRNLPRALEATIYAQEALLLFSKIWRYMDDANLLHSREIFDFCDSTVVDGASSKFLDCTIPFEIRKEVCEGGVKECVQGEAYLQPSDGVLKLWEYVVAFVPGRRTATALKDEIQVRFDLPSLWSHEDLGDWLCSLIDINAVLHENFVLYGSLADNSQTPLMNFVALVFEIIKYPDTRLLAAADRAKTCFQRLNQEACASTSARLCAEQALARAQVLALEAQLRLMQERKRDLARVAAIEDVIVMQRAQAELKSAIEKTDEFVMAAKKEMARNAEINQSECMI